MSDAGRPMNEYELGMMNVLLALTLAVLKVGANADELTEQLRSFQKQAFDAGKKEAGAIPAIIANAIDKARGRPI